MRILRNMRLPRASDIETTWNMTRIAVLGNVGGGKSTICSELGRALKIPVYPLDRLAEEARQSCAPRGPKEEFARRHDELIRRDRWIIDGFGSWESMEKRLDAADTIIFVDHPVWVNCWWALKRQLKWILGSSPDRLYGRPMLPSTRRLFKMIWRGHKRGPRLLERINARRSGKKVFHIRSPRELREFLRRWRNEKNEKGLGES